MKALMCITLTVCASGLGITPSRFGVKTFTKGAIVSKRYGATTDISMKVPEEIHKQFLETVERDIIFRATKEGFKIVGNWSHRKELCLHTNEETGETYEYYKIFSSVEVSDE
jgi:hypothetical protein